MTADPSKLAELKRHWGNEYPVAVTVGGLRLPLQRETRFSRHYYNKRKRHSAYIPRFMDGSATISAAELRKEWPAWSDEERHDFCRACTHIPQGQADLPDILRFVMTSDGPSHWSSVALGVAVALPKGEAFAVLSDALRRAKGEHTANLTQAISITKHPRAMALLRKHLKVLWSRPDFWNDAGFINWSAFDATCCIQHLIDLGAPPSEFAEEVRALSKHKCKDNRETCSRYLQTHFKWLPHVK